MHQNIKKRVKHGKELSEYSISQTGVKQGENVSPFFFSLFLNDLESFFEENNEELLCNTTNLCEESIQMYIKLFLILYADDTALMNESSDGLQKTLYCFEKYCDLWKLTVNTTTTKVVIFSKKKVRQN